MNRRLGVFFFVVVVGFFVCFAILQQLFCFQGKGRNVILSSYRDSLREAEPAVQGPLLGFSSLGGEVGADPRQELLRRNDPPVGLLYQGGEASILLKQPHMAGKKCTEHMLLHASLWGIRVLPGLGFFPFIWNACV